MHTRTFTILYSQIHLNWIFFLFAYRMSRQWISFNDAYGCAKNIHLLTTHTFSDAFTFHAYFRYFSVVLRGRYAMCNLLCLVYFCNMSAILTWREWLRNLTTKYDQRRTFSLYFRYVNSLNSIAFVEDTFTYKKGVTFLLRECNVKTTQRKENKIYHFV